MTDLRLPGERDRRVHATYWGMEIVRYNRAGKWYLEPRDKSLPRQKVSIEQAALQALWGLEQGEAGIIYEGLPGGKTFDRLVGRIKAARNL